MILVMNIVYVLRFINNCLKSTKISSEICAEDALKRCIRWEQISIVADKHFNNLKKQLLFYDGEGIIHLQGRLEKSYLPFDTKHPILLNRGSCFTRLVILHTHFNVKHMRVKATLNEVRSMSLCKLGFRRASIRIITFKNDMQILYLLIIFQV